MTIPDVIFTGRIAGAAPFHATPVDPKDASPFEWLKLYLDESLVQHIAMETNYYR